MVQLRIKNQGCRLEALQVLTENFRMELLSWPDVRHQNFKAFHHGFRVFNQLFFAMSDSHL